MNYKLLHIAIKLSKWHPQVDGYIRHTFGHITNLDEYTRAAVWTSRTDISVNSPKRDNTIIRTRRCTIFRITSNAYVHHCPGSFSNANEKLLNGVAEVFDAFQELSGSIVVRDVNKLRSGGGGPWLTRGGGSCVRRSSDDHDKICDRICDIRWKKAPREYWVPMAYAGSFCVRGGGGKGGSPRA